MISIIITWRNREELFYTFPFMESLRARMQGEMIIVNFGGSAAMLTEQLKGCKKKRLKIVNVKDQPLFNKSCAQNIGASHASHPILFFCDCDVIIHDETLSALVYSLKHHANTFATVAFVKETRPNSGHLNNVICAGYVLQIHARNGRTLELKHLSEDTETGIRMAPGLLLVKLSDFLSIGGFNSTFLGWGWESQDIICRLILGAGLSRINEGEAIHISHDDNARIKYASTTNRWEGRDKNFRRAIANYNNGDYHGTYFSDIHQVNSEIINWTKSETL